MAQLGGFTPGMKPSSSRCQGWRASLAGDKAPVSCDGEILGAGTEPTSSGEPLAGITAGPTRRSYPVPSPNKCQGLAQPFPTVDESAQLSLVFLDRAHSFGADSTTSDPQLFPWQKFGPR